MLKKAENPSCHVSSTISSIQLVKRVSRDTVLETELAVKLNRHQNILVFLTYKSPYSIEGLWKPIDPARKVARTYQAS